MYEQVSAPFSVDRAFPNKHLPFFRQLHVIQACGVCHSDLCSVLGLIGCRFPAVPGHEVVGKVSTSHRSAPSLRSLSSKSSATGADRRVLFLGVVHNFRSSVRSRSLPPARAIPSVIAHDFQTWRTTVKPDELISHDYRSQAKECGHRSRYAVSCDSPRSLITVVEMIATIS